MPHLHKALLVSDIFALGTFLLDKEQKQKVPLVFQYILQLLQWGNFEYTATEIK